MSRATAISVVASRGYLPAASGADDVDAIAVKISGPSYELNIWLALHEIDRLRDVPTAPWADGSIRAGTSANAPAFWSCDEGEVFIAVGRDDETWDFGVSLAMADFHAMIAEIEQELGGPQADRND